MVARMAIPMALVSDGGCCVPESGDGMRTATNARRQAACVGQQEEVYLQGMVLDHGGDVLSCEPCVDRHLDHRLVELGNTVCVGMSCQNDIGKTIMVAHDPR
jgi:hypothetical protein